MTPPTDGRGRTIVPAFSAYNLIATVGIQSVESHPACDDIKLSDGRVLTHWFGGGVYDCWWEVNR